jgi:hypothetical protein
MSTSSPDYRHGRHKLPPEAFALSEGDDPAPTDQIAPHIWHRITNLPDDVSLRTSDYDGTLIGEACELWTEWTSIGLALAYLDPNDPNRVSNLCSFIVIDELQASLYLALTGYYRQAIGGLRLALEAGLASAYFNSGVATAANLTDWIDGTLDLQANMMRQKLISKEPYKHIAVMMQDHGWIHSLTRQLNRYSHAGMPTSNAEFWQSNGPIYVEAALPVWAELYFEVGLAAATLIGMSDLDVFAATYPAGYSFASSLHDLMKLQRQSRPIFQEIESWTRAHS